jgi:hypothetical protein
MKGIQNAAFGQKNGTQAERIQKQILFLIMKANEMHYFSNLFDKALYMFRTGPLSIINSISTLYTQQYMLVLLAVCLRGQNDRDSRQPTELA